MAIVSNTTEKPKVFLAVFGIITSMLVGISEFYLHYSPNVLGFEEQFQFFQEVSLENLEKGHWFILIGIPFYFGGYLHIYQMLKMKTTNLEQLYTLKNKQRNAFGST